jgi:eukaryotic-like serine/threonine-protein kinase
VGAAYTVLTRPGQVVGTLDYLAPELVRGEAATPASDIYALVCVAFECLAGRAPFADRRLFGVGSAHLGDDPPDPPAPPQVAWALSAGARERPGRQAAHRDDVSAPASRGGEAVVTPATDSGGGGI